LIYFLAFFAIIALTSLIIQNLISIRIIRSLVSLLVTPFIALVTLWLAGRYLDHRKFKDYGFNLTRRWWLDFIFGFILSALLFCIVFLFEKVMGWINIVDYFQNQREGYIGMPFIIPLIIGFIAYFSVGLYEEILFRVYQISNLSEGFNKKNSKAKQALIGAYILSSIIFSIFHSGNPNITFIGLINLMFLGLFLGLPYVLSGQIGMSIALHISWNFFQGLVFGFPVSGVFNNTTVIAIKQGGPTIWTGGAFGPEGGLIGSFTLLVGCSFIMLWFKILGRPKFLFTRMAEYNSLNIS
jgi:membrane protease YdiL (CAAX protease family)